MKTKFIIIASISILMVSCSKKFIDILPESAVTVEDVYKTDKDYHDAVIGIYNALQGPYGQFWEFGDLRGDDTQQDVERALDRLRVDNFSMDVNDGLLSSSWSGYYNLVFRANTLLSHIETADASVITNKDIYIGETRFLRALAYFDLVRIWGNVPLMTAPISIEESYEIGREDVDVIYNELIIKDLLVAKNNLPASYPSNEVGRATKGAATALLGKVYLTRKDFVKAESELHQVTTMGYKLLANYNDLFDYTNEHHSEYIFDVEYADGGLGIGSPFTSTFIQERHDVGAALADEIRRIYNIQSPESGGMGTPGAALRALFDPKDLRKDVTVATGVNDQNGNFIPIAGSTVSAFSKKYMTSETINYDSKANWKVIRYADVLLMYAEALNENDKIGDALDYLNIVRQRAGLGSYDGLSKDETRERIYLERRFELNLEGERWFDLVRTGRALEVMQPYGMKPHHIVFPIPQNQIEVVNNPDVFFQNEGY